MGSSQPTHQHSQPTKLYNYFKQHFTKQVKMKVSQVAAVLAVTASASAAPWKYGKSWGGHWKGGWKNGHEQKCMDGPVEFTSTYSVVAPRTRSSTATTTQPVVLPAPRGFMSMVSIARRITSAGTSSSRTSGVTTSLRLTPPPTFMRHPRASLARHASLSPTRFLSETARRGSALGA